MLDHKAAPAMRPRRARCKNVHMPCKVPWSLGGEKADKLLTDPGAWDLAEMEKLDL